MIRPLAALLAPLVVITGLVLGFRLDGDDALQSVGSVPVEAPAALGAALEARPPAVRREGAASRTADVATAEEEPDPLPLDVTLDSLSTAVVPERGPVVVRGRVGNNSDETWTDVNVYACTSGSPLTTTHELAHAADATTDDVVCGRTSVFVTIEEIAPGESIRYVLRVPRDRLGIGTRPGAYWFGVQALGSSAAGRDALADGTVRTFLPLVGDRASLEQAAFSLVLPIRGRTLHNADGRLAAEDTWKRDLARGGRLSNMLTLAETAPAGRATLLVDPAVLVAARQMAAGNPERTLGVPVTGKSEEDEEDEEDEDAEETPAAEEPADDGSDSDEPEGDAGAAEWLRRFEAVAGRLPVLGLPYGDLDVSAAARNDLPALKRSRAESEAAFEGFGITATPAIVPPNGVLSPAALRHADGAAVIVSSAALPEELAAAETIPATVRIDGQQVRVAEASLGEGGPGPTDGTRALALRQRLLAEGVVRARSGATATTYVVLPHSADPGPTAASFFEQLDRPFIRLTGASPSTTNDVDIDELDYPVGQNKRELPKVAFTEAARLTEFGDTLDRLLAANDGVARTAAREALSGTSYFARDSSLAAADLAGAATASVQGAASWFSQRLAEVDVAVPNFVILGSTEGPFAMTVTNGLERPIRLGVRATTSEGLTIRAPRTVDVPASSSRTVNLVAKTSEPGVHSLVLVVTDEDGRPIRKSQDISVRSRDVGWVIWLIMGGGATLLFGAIVMRWRSRRRAPLPLPTPEAPEAP